MQEMTAGDSRMTAEVTLNTLVNTSQGAESGRQ